MTEILLFGGASGGITPTAEQRRVLDEIDHWLRHERGQVLQVKGPAGTSKSTIAAWVLEQYPNSIGLCFQAKAVSVLRGKGARNVTTIRAPRQYRWK